MNWKDKIWLVIWYSYTIPNWEAISDEDLIWNIWLLSYTSNINLMKVGLNIVSKVASSTRFVWQTAII